MHVVVIGAGVIGVTTAYYLSHLGCRVTVVDRASEVAHGATFANAGQLSYSFTDALARPDFFSQVPALLVGSDPAYRIRLTRRLIPWGLRFLSQCTRRRAMDNTVAVLQSTLRSKSLMETLENELPFDFSHQPAGKLVLLESDKELRSAQANAKLKQRHGCDTRLLDRDGAIAIEPALAEFTGRFVGAVYSKSDSVADAYSFTVGLKGMLERSGRVDFMLGVETKKFLSDGQQLKAVVLDDGELRPDATVVCAGAWSGGLLRPLGVNPHVYPVRGYTITLPARDLSPAVSVTALSKKIVFSRLNGSVRIAGFADFTGFRTDRDAERIVTLANVAREFAPLAADYDAGIEKTQWGGFRPMTPDGRPLVGPTRIKGLYLNTGHGMLGWTLACASASDVAHSIAGNPGNPV